MSDTNKEVSYIQEVVDTIRNTIGIKENEIELLLSIHEIINRPIPTTSSAVGSMINIVDKNRPELLNLIYMVTSKYNRLKSEYQKGYDNQMAIELRIVKNSNFKVLESMIHKDIPALANLREVLDNYDSFKGLLYGYLKSLDNVKSTLMIKWTSKDAY